MKIHIWLQESPLPYGIGEEIDGYETVAAMRFADAVISPGETKTYIIALGYGNSEEEIDKLGEKYLDTKAFDSFLEETKKYWQDKINVSYNSADSDFDNWMHWVNFQPMLRRIYGCSFLPHHDYGKRWKRMERFMAGLPCPSYYGAKAGTSDVN